MSVIESHHPSLDKLTESTTFALGDIIMMASTLRHLDLQDPEYRQELESSDLYQVMAPHIGSTALQIETSLKPNLQLVD